MLSLETLKKKIKTTKDLLSVVRTMKSLAAVNIRQYEGAVVSLEHYSQVVDIGWQALFQTPLRMLPAGDDRQVLFLVIGSDQGMCGQFNEVIVNRAADRRQTEQTNGREITFWTSGERVRSGLEDLQAPFGEHFILPGSLTGIVELVRQVIETFEQWRQSRGFETLEVIYNQLVKGGGYEPVSSRLLPLDSQWVDQYREKKWPDHCIPLLGTDREDLFRHLFRQYLFVSLYKAFAQSMASENAARLRSMQAAEKNIRELGETLQGKFRETRQNIITSELLDIISGFEAVSGGSKQ
ncbi:MAG: F0F1 ATP synthase subunit gamma [Desulfobacterales bacterium]|nr:F0F1 ATP synthase subunit gamma [Desulfobacterales bacterium]